tara:strand:+ start:379 stop:864 length:486 start_codon:yes stop_codon:yes gene_type:complete
MKKKLKFISSIFFVIFLFSCAGYEPVYKSSSLKFKIEEYEIQGNNELSNNLYTKINRTLKYNENNPASKSISLLINVTKNKKATAKNSAGKILEYKITINSKIIVSNYLTDTEILSKDFNSSLSYKVQEQFSETIKIENKLTDDLLNRIHENFLIELSQNY